MISIIEHATSLGFCHVFRHDSECIDVFKVWNLVADILPQYVSVPKWSLSLDEITWTYLDDQVNPWYAALDEPHYSLILEADLSFPIIIADGAVVDGNHRLMKAYLLSLPEILAVRVDWDRLVKNCQFVEEDYKEVIIK